MWLLSSNVWAALQYAEAAETPLRKSKADGKNWHKIKLEGKWGFLLSSWSYYSQIILSANHTVAYLDSSVHFSIQALMPGAYRYSWVRCKRKMELGVISILISLHFKLEQYLLSAAYRWILAVRCRLIPKGLNRSQSVLLLLHKVKEDFKMRLHCSPTGFIYLSDFDCLPIQYASLKILAQRNEGWAFLACGIMLVSISLAEIC